MPTGEQAEEKQEVISPPSRERDLPQPKQPNKRYGFEFEDLPSEAVDYIKALRQENKERREFAEDLQARHSDLVTRLEALEQQRVSQLEQDGNYRELAVTRARKIEELQPMAEEAEKLRNRIRASNEARITALPEKAREAVPTMLPPDVLADWLDKYAGVFALPSPPELDGGKGTRGSSGGRPPTITPQDQAIADFARTQGFNVSAEALAARRRAMPIPTPLNNRDINGG